MLKPHLTKFLPLRVLILYSAQKDRKNIVTLVEELNTESNINHVSDIMSNHEFEEPSNKAIFK